MATKITLEDHGQDFLVFVLDAKKQIVATRPFQGWVWNGSKILNRSIKPGDLLRLRDKAGDTRTLRYPVELVEREDSGDAHK